MITCFYFSYKCFKGFRWWGQAFGFTYISSRQLIKYKMPTNHYLRSCGIPIELLSNCCNFNYIIPSIFNSHWTVLWRHREYRRVAAAMLLAVCMKYWPCLKSRSFMPPVMRRHATILYVCKSSQKRKVLPTYSNFEHSVTFWQNL